MRSAAIISAAALVGLAAASPAPQQLDFDQLAAAPTVQTAPVLNGVSNQTVVISSSAIAQSISSAVSTTATAVTTAPAQVVNKRNLDKRTIGVYNWFNCMFFGIQCGDSTTSTTSSSVKTTSTSSTKTSSSSVVSAKATSTSSSSSSSVVVVKSSSSSSSAAASSAAASSTSSGSATVNTVSGTTSSTTACPTTPEEGTYCGFINPEDPCAPQPDGYGPKVTPDTDDAFLAYAPFHSMATNAPVVVASNSNVGNAYLQTFRDLNASSSANSYLGLYTLSSYNVSDCAAHCDTTSLCTAFNIYIERDPSQNPSKNDSTAPTVWGYWCPNPSSITNFKCTLWGSNLEASTATNQGEWREDFHVVVTGSNGYDATNTTIPPPVVDTVDNSTSTSVVLSSATAASSSIVKSSSASSAAASATASSGPKQPTWSSPTTCGGKAINAPNYWMGSKFFPGPFNPQVCGDYASYQHVLNKRAAIQAGKSYFTPCNSFNAYYLHKNGVPHGTYCALYDASISTSYATYSGGMSGSNKYDCRQSYQYTRQTLDQGRC
jgi:hypothetical protein